MSEKFPRVWLGPEEYDDQGLGIGLDVSPIKTERHKDEAMFVSEHEALIAEANDKFAKAIEHINEIQGQIMGLGNGRGVTVERFLEVWNHNARFLSAHVKEHNEFLAKAAELRGSRCE